MARFTSTDQSIGAQMTNVSRKITNLFAGRLKPYNITPEQWSVLYQVCRNEGINQKTIAMRSNKDQPTVTRILDVLDNKQFIERKADPSDRRAFLIYATPSAKVLISDTVPLEIQLNEQLVQGITDEQLDLLLQITEQINHNLDIMNND